MLILVLANGLTTKVIAMNDQILKEIVLLAAFIPLLIGTEEMLALKAQLLLLEV